jgi:transcriptional regulator with XRE-family HTH domain
MKSSAKTIAKVNPSMLVWARKEGDLSLEAVAKRMDIKTGVLSSWESGSRFPTYKQLVKLSRDIYKRPSAIFFSKDTACRCPD